MCFENVDGIGFDKLWLSHGQSIWDESRNFRLGWLIRVLA